MSPSGPINRPRVSRRVALGGLGAVGLTTAAGSQSGQVAALQAEIEFERGLVYGVIDGQDLLMDVVRPVNLDEPLPAILLIHGGSFAYGSRSEMSGFASALAQAGYAAFSVDYRLFNPSSGLNAWPTGLHDVQRAVRWLRAHANEQRIDPERVGVLGHSTGGHLAACLGTQETRDNNVPELEHFSSKVTCVIDMSGETDFTIPYSEFSSDTALYAKLLGGSEDVPPSADAYRDLSPITFVDRDTSPFLIIHGSIDDAVPVEHSRHMEAALHEAGIEVIYAEFPGKGHIEVFSWSLVGSLILAVVDRHLRVTRV